MIFCALDTPDMAQAESFAKKLSGAGLHFKLGLEFFTAQGIAGVEKIRSIAPAAYIFLDLKFHDIPNTVAGAVKSALAAKPQFMTVHAAGGSAMMKAAVEAASGKTKILAVTILTSLEDSDLALMGQPKAEEQVLRLAKLAKEAGVDGVVCSPREIALLRRELGRDFLLVVPGIRPAGSEVGDQKRTLTPKEALAAGATHLVIGRPITAANDPLAAAQEILSAA